MTMPVDTSTDMFQLPVEVADARAWAHDFAVRYIRPVAAVYDEREETPWPVIQDAAKVGLYTPEFAFRGFTDPSGLMLPVVFEEIYWGDAGIGQALMNTFLPLAALAFTGTPNQMTTWLPAFFGSIDKPAVAALCASEPEAGSDAASIRTRADFDQASNQWVLNGTKTWATNGGIADVHVISASVDRDLGARGHALFLIPPGTHGLSQGQKFSKHGLRASHTAEVLIDNVRLPADLVLGGKDALDQRLAIARERGKVRAKAAMATFEACRPAVAAMAIGVARAAYEFALDYAKSRVQFGRPIIYNQAIAFTLADMALEIDAARLLAWRASSQLAHGKPLANGEGSMAKVKASEVAVRTTERAIQILGGNGYTVTTRSNAGHATPRSLPFSKALVRSSD